MLLELNFYLTLNSVSAEKTKRLSLPRRVDGSQNLLIMTTARTPVTKRAREEPPALDDLLVALDVAPREESQETVNTILALVDRAEADGVSPHDYLVLAVLIAFRRRNHAASQAAGHGAGERRLLRTVLSAVAAHDPESVKRVLPLVPLYGCWKDLRLLAEELLVDGTSAEAESAALPPLVDAVCECFAQQFQKDNDELVVEDKLPSSAAKYSPHEATLVGPTGPITRPRRRHRSQARPVDGVATSTRCAAAVGGCVAEQEAGGEGLHARAAAERARLDANGFTKAPKTALAKCKKAIMKDAAAAAR